MTRCDIYVCMRVAVVLLLVLCSAYITLLYVTYDTPSLQPRLPKTGLRAVIGAVRKTMTEDNAQFSDNNGKKVNNAYSIQAIKNKMERNGVSAYVKQFVKDDMENKSISGDGDHSHCFKVFWDSLMKLRHSVIDNSSSVNQTGSKSAFKVFVKDYLLKSSTPQSKTEHIHSGQDNKHNLAITAMRRLYSYNNHFNNEGRGKTKDHTLLSSHGTQHTGVVSNKSNIERNRSISLQERKDSTHLLIPTISTSLQDKGNRSTSLQDQHRSINVQEHNNSTSFQITTIRVPEGGVKRPIYLDNYDLSRDRTPMTNSMPTVEPSCRNFISLDLMPGRTGNILFQVGFNCICLFV